MTSSILTILILTTVLAGKLHDDNGFRGKQFGPASVLSEAPMSGCVKNPEMGTIWICKTTISDHTVFVRYKVSEGYFWSVDIASSGYPECQDIFYVLLVAWGVPKQEDPSVEMYKWSDTPVFATYTYYNVNATCIINITNVIILVEAAFQESDRILERASTHIDDL